MGLFTTIDTDYVDGDVDGITYRLLSKQAYSRFGLDLLNLGDIGSDSTTVDSIAVVFDLQGFSSFCNQREPHLTVPPFLKAFLKWLMNAIRVGMVEKEVGEGMALWTHLPYFVKFMGDGLLVLWDAASPGMGSIGRRNVIACMDDIRLAYQSQFLPSIDGVVINPPPALRCGIARGLVYTLGNGNDCVGNCINMAARLQKLPGITFAFHPLGFDLIEKGAARFFSEGISIHTTTIRGFGENERVAILRQEYRQMAEEDRSNYSAPLK